MASIEELDKAIAAHGMWKARLRAAIDTGRFDTPVESIRQDHQCPFGKWLYGPLMARADRSSDHYRAVKDLHAQFHQTAARVAELALNGNKRDAEAMMALNGEYSVVSARLTQAMVAWKKDTK